MQMLVLANHLMRPYGAASAPGGGRALVPTTGTEPPKADAMKGMA
jgi:hypothetical protein